jgi:hypothetical protein
MRDHARYQPDPERLGGVYPARRQQQVPRLGHADVNRQDRGIGRVDDATQQFGHAKARPLADHGDVGQHRDQQPARLAYPVDRCDHRRGAVADREKGESLVGQSFGHPFVAGLVTPAEVAPRGKGIFRAGYDQRAQIGVRIDQPHRPLEPEIHRRGQGVARLRAVDRAPGDGSIALEPQGLGSEIIRGHGRFLSR